MLFFLRNKSRKREKHLSFDEMLADLPGEISFDRERMEGVLEKPFSRLSFFILIFVLAAAATVILGRVFLLSIVNGDRFLLRAEDNRLRKELIQPKRGIIYDRKGNVIVENIWSEEKRGLYRKLRHPTAYSHVIGFLGRPSPTDFMSFSELGDFSFLGKDGIEYFYDEILRGELGYEIEEVDAMGNTVSRGIIQEPKDGKSIFLSIEGALQEMAFEVLSQTAELHGFRGGAMIVFDITNGEILALASYPSFDVNALSRGISAEKLAELVEGAENPFFNRVIAGLYPPGSTIKPYLALAGLEEHIIEPEKKILSTGSISLPNPYDENLRTLFLDWKAHGWVDMRRALAVSSNVYFYTLGGGYGDIHGLGIRRIKKWLEYFGFAQLTGIDLAGEVAGIVPDPAWKETLHPENPLWRIGDTYNVSIGQGDTLITPLEAARALTILASSGQGQTPHLVLGFEGSQGIFLETVLRDATPDQSLAVTPPSFEVVKEGMREAVLYGTASALSQLQIQIAGKTGTAESGNRHLTHSWFIGFAPFDNPRIGTVVFLESGPKKNLVGGVAIALELFRWIENHGGIEAILAKSVL